MLLILGGDVGGFGGQYMEGLTIRMMMVMVVMMTMMPMMMVVMITMMPMTISAWRDATG